MKVGRARRGVAGIVAIVIIFAILFTVGTSYYIFVNAQNAKYAQTLLAAASKTQGMQAESLTVTTLLESNGDVGFFANNTSTVTANMTAALVMSSTGTLLTCVGVGFPAGAGCTNSTPALPMTVNADGGTKSADTGYLYLSGTTDTVKVLTARGNIYLATYPESGAQSGSTQSVTVNLDNLKWVQLVPQASSLVQKKYVSNCNAAACAASFTSSVTAGNILVDAVGWGSQAPPSGVPTDTRGDSFTLGASTSTNVASTPSLVQNRYTSNCNAASCGLAFSSNVGSGDTLVYAVGWSSQSPPSSPTDTRGDTFTLGSSNSVTVSPPSPALVQSRYNSNCNSATCALAYSSSVTAGNTLVLGLGWYGTAPYVPVTLSNCVSGCGSGEVLDGSTGSNTETSSTSASLTTANSNDVIILAAGTSSSAATVSSVSDTAGLTWTHRTSEAGSSSVEVEEWYATANSPLSADSITVTWSATGDNTFSVFGISYANTASPFDTNGGLPAKATGTTTTPSVSVSTSNANDFIYGLLANEHTSSTTCHTETDGTGFTDTGATQCAVGGGTNQNNDQEYEVVSSTQTGLSVPFTTTTGGSNQWAMIGDAVVAAAGSATPTNFQEMVTWDPATYSTYEATNLGNVRFCLDSACATPLYAWLESCSSTCSTSGSSSTSATAWVNLGTHAISSGGTLTIYMVFYSTSTAFDDNYWGEAPTLSSTYGQYDNGAKVFSDYGAFQGSSLPAGWSLSGAASYVGGTSNTGGVRLVSNAGNQYGVATSTKAFSTVGACFETSAEYNGNADDVGQGFYSSGAGTGTGGGNPSTTNANGYYAGYEYYSGSAPQLRQSTTTLATASSQTMPTSGTNFLFMQTCSTSGQITMKFVTNTGSQYASGVYSGLTSTVTYTATISAGASTSYVGAATGGATSYAYLFWDRIRIYPPGGVMPSTSFGSQSVGSGTPTVSDTLGDAFALGVSNTVGVSNTYYYSYIWYATASSSGSNTVTASFLSTVTGSISIYELAGYSTASPSSSTGSSAGGSTSISVTSFTPATNSFVIGNAESASSSSTYTAGSGLTLIATCSSVYGCSEYKSGVGSATTVPMSLGASTPWVESSISFAPAVTNTYYSYVWYATAGSAGADTISASFSQTVTGAVSIYEISAVTATGLLSSTGGSSTSQSSSSVTSMTPSTGSVVIGNTESTSTTYTAGSGYTLSGSCSSVAGCGEYQTGVGSATTVPLSFGSSGPWAEAAVAFAPTTTNYYSYIWYATAASSGADTVTATFGQTVAGSVSLYEITGYTTSGVLSSTGSLSTGSTTAAVTSFTPSSDSFIVGNAEASSSSTTYTATSGFTLVGTCNSVGGCSEYNAGGGGSASTVPMTLGASTPWVEAALSFSTPFNPQSGIQVGGYPTMGVPSGASLVWEVTFTNVDPNHRAVTIWPQTELAIGSAEFDGFDTDYTQAHYYIIDSLNPGSTTVNGYTSTTGLYTTLAYGVPTTLYFAATQALGSTTQAFGTNVLTPFQAYFALTGIFSDGTLYGETIPYPYGIITQANAYTTPTAGGNAATVTVSCTSPCHFNANSKAMVGWINAAGVMTQLTTFTTTAGGNIPAGVTFTVPTAAAGYDTVEVTDYTNTVFATFQHT